ncbi:MAG: hypothetical protein WC360_09215, partial [Opitutales bacterium]
SVSRAPGDAANLLLEGGFNVNTASAVAWKALLRSLAFPGWSAAVPGKSAGVADLSAPLFSLPWSAASPPTAESAAAVLSGGTATYDCMDHPPLEDRRHPAFLVGMRDIGASIDDLAAQIAARIKARGRPFHSLSELAQSGLLQEAIDAVPALNRRSWTDDAIPAGATAHVDQGLLLCALSPMIFTRSDTFRVRFFGEDSASGAKAWAEAVVQRLPEPVGGDAAANGRKFRILQFRWLEEADL